MTAKTQADRPEFLFGTKNTYTEHGHKCHFFRPHPQPLSCEERGTEEGPKTVTIMPSLTILSSNREFRSAGCKDAFE
jgi:hypothetical protein